VSIITRVNTLAYISMAEKLRERVDRIDYAQLHKSGKRNEVEVSELNENEEVDQEVGLGLVVSVSQDEEEMWLEKVEQSRKEWEEKQKKDRIQQLKKEYDELQMNIKRKEVSSKSPESDEMENMRKKLMNIDNFLEDPDEDEDMVVAHADVPEKIVSFTGKNRLRSGLQIKAADIVRSPQLWPHLALHEELVDRQISYQELDMRLFVSGELEIISSNEISETERKSRLSLLKKINDLSGTYEFNLLSSIYAVIVRKIENGLAKWGDDFSQVINWMATKNARTNNLMSNSFVSKKTSYMYNKNSNFNKNRYNRSYKGNQTFWCRDYNRTGCSLPDGHTGNFKGENVNFSHICAACYNRDKTKVSHPESSPVCPHSEA
jgi:uncharacterized protein YdcH (DUF465 family)